MGEREASDEGIARAIRELLAARKPGRTICPSEAARALGGVGWRELMPRVREVADSMRVKDELRVMQKGKDVPSAVGARGPIRLALRTAPPTGGRSRPSS